MTDDNEKLIKALDAVLDTYRAKADECDGCGQMTVQCACDGTPVWDRTTEAPGHLDGTWNGPTVGWPASDITEVYTVEDQQANGALVQIDRYPGVGLDVYRMLGDGYAFSGWINHDHDRDRDIEDTRFLTTEAVAALGTFTKVPDRPIMVGLVVRHGLDGRPWTIYRIRDGIAYDYKNSGCPVSELSIVAAEDRTDRVAPEDAAYIAPPEIKEPEPALCGRPILTFKPGGTTCVRPKGHDGLHMRDVSDPSGDRPDPAPMPCEGKVCNCHEVTSPDPAPSIPEAWDLITAGDGRTFGAVATNTGYRWRPVDAVLHRCYSDAEILEMGPVRRCVPVTLPDEHHDTWSTLNGNVGIDPRALAIGYRIPRAARDFAAELLAAAIEAEEGEG